MPLGSQLSRGGGDPINPLTGLTPSHLFCVCSEPCTWFPTCPNMYVAVFLCSLQGRWLLVLLILLTVVHHQCLSSFSPPLISDGFSLFLLADVLLGSQCCLSTWLVANGIRLTKRCNALSSRSDVTRGLPDLGKSFTLLVCVFSHQSADYSIVVAHLTSNSFEGHPCCMHADYLPSLRFWYLPSLLTMLILRMNKFLKTLDLHT